MPDEFMPFERLVYESLLAAWFDEAVAVGKRADIATDRRGKPGGSLLQSAIRNPQSAISPALLADPGLIKIAGRFVFFPEIAKAFEFLRDREILSIDEFQELGLLAQRSAFTIAGVESKRALEASNDLLGRAILEGWGIERYSTELGKTFDDLGISRLEPQHTERVFRTSIAQSRSQAHDQVMAKPILAELFPFDRYDAIVDERSDPTHRVLDNWVFLHLDPIWNSGEQPLKPPRRPNCRCSRTSLSAEQFLELYRAGAIHYGSGPITIVDLKGKDVRIKRDGRVAGVLMAARVPDTGPYSGSGKYAA